MKKWSLILVSLIFALGLSCNSSNKGEGKETNADKAVQSTMSETTEKSTEPVKTATSAGEKLYSDKGCLVCHKLESKLVGFAVKDIAKAYSGNKAGLTAYLKGEAKAIVDPAQASVMQPQISITKNLPPEELNAIVDYILSVK